MKTPSRPVFLFALAGPLIWFAHLMTIYGAASISEVASGAVTVPWRIVVLVLTVVAALANATVIHRALRVRRAPAEDWMDENERRFWLSVAGVAALISLAAVIFQSLPVLLVAG